MLLVSGLPVVYVLLDVGTFDAFCGLSFVTFVTLHLLKKSNFWTQCDDNLPNTIHIFIRSSFPARRVSVFHTASFSQFLLLSPSALVSDVTPYLCLSALALDCWIQIFAYRSTVCIFCCIVAIVLIAQNTQAKLPSIKSCQDVRTTCVCRTVCTDSYSDKYQHHDVCFSFLSYRL